MKCNVIIILTVLSSLCVLFWGCDKKADNDYIAATADTEFIGETSVHTEIETEAPEHDEGVSEDETEAQDITIDLPEASFVPDEIKNITLEYPEDYLKDVVITESETDGVYKTLFTAKLADDFYDLFAVSYGEGGEGQLHGYLPSEDGKVAVYIICYSLPEENRLAEAEIMHYYELLDAINYVVDSINGQEGFIYS